MHRDLQCLHGRRDQDLRSPQMSSARTQAPRAELHHNLHPKEHLAGLLLRNQIGQRST
jgi:hypothetical protein